MTALPNLRGAVPSAPHKHDNSDEVRVARWNNEIEDAVSNADRAWFEANPDRDLRLRFALPGEMGLDVPPGSIPVLIRQLAAGVRLRGLILRFWPEAFPPPDSLPDDDTVRFLLWTAQASPAYLPLENEDWGRAFVEDEQLLATVQSKFDLWLSAVGGTA